MENNKFYYTNYRIIKSWPDLIYALKNNLVVIPYLMKSALAARNEMFTNNFEQDVAEFITTLLSYFHEGLCYKNQSVNIKNEEKK